MAAADPVVLQIGLLFCSYMAEKRLPQVEQNRTKTCLKNSLAILQARLNEAIQEHVSSDSTICAITCLAYFEVSRCSHNAIHLC
jgi:sensor domain CHASE-containing protein